MLIERRAFLALLGAVGATASGRASAQRRAPVEPVFPDEAFYDGVAEDGGFQFRRTNMNKIAPRFRRQLVKYIHKEPPGSLVVDTRNHALYVTFENNTALRYGVGVGKEGFQWFGRAEVGRKAVWPDWTPPAEMLARRPDLPRHMKGGPDNPLGPELTTSTATARTSSTASTAPPSPGRSAPTSLPAASACSTRT